MACGIALAVPVPVVASAATALVALLAGLGHVRQQRQLAGALHRRGDLVLMAAAGAGDPPRADLAALGDELAQRRDVLVVDELDLVAAVLARLAAAAAGTTLAVTPARRPAALLRHVGKTSLEVLASVAPSALPRSVWSKATFRRAHGSSPQRRRTDA